MKRNILLILSIIFIFSLGLSFWFSMYQSVSGSLEKSITIDKGNSADQIIKILIDNEVLNSRVLFKIALKIKSAEKKLKAGTYRIPSESSIAEIIDILAKGKVATKKLTIHEGSTMNSIANLLETSNIVAKSSFIEACTNKELLNKYGIPGSSMEGYLFPDTYEFNENDESERILEIFVQNFFVQVRLMNGGLLPDAKRLNEIVILASILEREYRIPSEAPKMASVFLNRIAIGMPLQSCATVVYILTDVLGKEQPKVIYYNDLQISHPYNTYLYRGLPPGPISNPGKTSISAVLYPEKSDYLYFRLKDVSTGEHRFSKTFEEHREESIPVKGY